MTCVLGVVGFLQALPMDPLVLPTFLAVVVVAPRVSEVLLVVVVVVIAVVAHIVVAGQRLPSGRISYRRPG